jgi:hypothetical protein
MKEPPLSVPGPVDKTQAYIIFVGSHAYSLDSMVSLHFIALPQMARRAKQPGEGRPAFITANNKVSNGKAKASCVAKKTKKVIRNNVVSWRIGWRWFMSSHLDWYRQGMADVKCEQERG